MAHVNGADRSVGTLVKQGTEQLSQLMRQELRLAQAEIAQKGKRAGRGGGLFGAAALLGFFGLASLITAAIVAVDLQLQLWAAALIIGGGLLLFAALLAMAGRSQVRRAGPAMPGEAVGSVRHDLETIKERAKR